jgi:hypothetical protein
MEKNALFGVGLDELSKTIPHWKLQITDALSRKSSLRHQTISINIPSNDTIRSRSCILGIFMSQVPAALMITPVIEKTRGCEAIAVPPAATLVTRAVSAEFAA